MKIECIFKREGGSRIDIGGLEYHFEPLPDGAHVANVEDKQHRDRFLSIAEGYKIYDGEHEPTGTPTQIQPSVTNDPKDTRLAGVKTGSADTLMGSSVHESIYDIGGQTYQLGDIVSKAFTASGMTAVEWNAMPEDDRNTRIDMALDDIAEQVEKDTGSDAEREVLAEQYKEKFGKAPHYRLTADKIKAALAE